MEGHVCAVCCALKEQKEESKATRPYNKNTDNLDGYNVNGKCVFFRDSGEGGAGGALAPHLCVQERKNKNKTIMMKKERIGHGKLIRLMLSQCVVFLHSSYLHVQNFWLVWPQTFYFSQKILREREASIFSFKPPPPHTHTHTPLRSQSCPQLIIFVRALDDLLRK